MLFGFDSKDGLELGIYTLGDHIPNPHTGQRISQQQRVQDFIRYAQEAEAAGLDFFSVGESHQAFFASQAHTVILAAIAQATEKIKIGSASTIISTSDPVRVFEDFATIDLISNGRVEIIAGRASRVGLFELLGYDIRDYDGLYEEKLELLRLINQEEIVNWQGEFRAALNDASVLPRPINSRQLPIWRAVGGHETSAIQAGRQGIPIFLAHLTGAADFHKRTLDVYRNSLKESGFDPAEFPVATAGMFYAAETSQQARKEAYPYIGKGFMFTNGQPFPKRAFAQSEDIRDIMNVGSPQEIIEKILYQYEIFGIQRYIAQIDFGGVPFDKLMQNLEYLANDIIPAVKKYTRSKESDHSEPQDITQFKQEVAGNVSETDEEIV